MNAKTAKLLHRYSTLTKSHYRRAKRHWTSVPVPQRHRLRQEIEAKVAELA